MATHTTHAPQDLATPYPSVPTAADIERRLAELQDYVARQERNASSTPEEPEWFEQALFPEQPQSRRAARPQPKPQPPAPLELEKAALHGPAGRVVTTLAPHTEAHPAALLLQCLAAFGNLIGPDPHCRVESTRHALNLFVILVGESSKARKGASWNLIANLFAEVDPAWLATRVNSARITAPGLVKALRDQQPPTDRRLLALAEEFGAVVHSLNRGNGHLSTLLRCAWDQGDLPTLDMNHQLRATGAHLSLIAHITQHELTQTFRRTQVQNGFANRCLWTAVERSNCLPDGGSPPASELSAIAETLRTAAAWANSRPQILFRRDEEATRLWAKCYAELSYSQPGVRGAATSRGEAQVLRLSALYAALDCSEMVRLPHLEAAYSVWTYCYQSATRLFGLATGDSIADRILEAVNAAPAGLTKNQISRLFSGHVDCERIDAALEQLAGLGALSVYNTQTGGRPATLWGSALRQNTNTVTEDDDLDE